MLKYMLDTNIVIDVIKTRPHGLLELFNKHVGSLCISSITLSELLCGAEKSKDPKQNKKQIDDFISRLEVLDYGKNAASEYGVVCSKLKKTEIPTSIEDLYVASHAISEKLIVITNRPQKFGDVVGLDIESWFYIPTDIPGDILSVASANRRFIFRKLIRVIDDLSLMGHLITKVAKEEGLIAEDKSKLKGNTIQEWANSWEISGKNTPNAWACRAAASLLVNGENPLVFESLEDYLAVIYYLNPSQDLETLLKSKKLVDSKI